MISISIVEVAPFTSAPNLRKPESSYGGGEVASNGQRPGLFWVRFYKLDTFLLGCLWGRVVSFLRCGRKGEAILRRHLPTEFWPGACTCFFHRVDNWTSFAIDSRSACGAPLPIPRHISPRLSSTARESPAEAALH